MPKILHEVSLYLDITCPSHDESQLPSQWRKYCSAAGTPIPPAGLSTGAKTGIGVGAGVGFLAVITVVLFIMSRRKRQKKKKRANEGGGGILLRSEDGRYSKEAAHTTVPEAAGGPLNELPPTSPRRAELHGQAFTELSAPTGSHELWHESPPVELGADVPMPRDRI